MLRSAAAPMRDLHPRRDTTPRRLTPASPVSVHAPRPGAPRRTRAPSRDSHAPHALLVLFPFFSRLVALDPHADLVDTQTIHQVRAQRVLLAVVGQLEGVSLFGDLIN